MNIDEWSLNAKKKVNFMTKNVWNGLDHNDVYRFLGNFDDDIEIGLALMEMLVFYSIEQEVLLASSVFNQMKREIWYNFFVKSGNQISNSIEINNYINNFLNDTCFVPLEDNDPSGSAYSITSIYKQMKEFPKKIEFCNINDVPLLLASKKKGIVLYDDVIGSGTQFDNFWNINHHFNRKITLNQLAELNKDTQFFYLVFGANKLNLDKLKAKYPAIKILAAELYEPEDSVINEKNEYWEFNPELKNKVINYVNSKIRELSINNKFGSNISILFQHSRAQNTTLPLYWINKPGKWEELYRR